MQLIRLLLPIIVALFIFEAKVRSESTSPVASSSPPPSGTFEDEQQQHVDSDSLLLLCTADGSIFVLNAWTGKLLSRSLTGIPLLTRSVSSSSNTQRQQQSSNDGSNTQENNTDDDNDDAGEDSIMLANHIVPGLDGKLYWQENDVNDAGDGDNDLPLQPLPLSIPSLLAHPVRTCPDGSKKSCGILHAVEHTVLYGLDPQSGNLQWSTGRLFGWSNNEPENDSSADPSFLILQRKDVSIQQVSSRTGKQLWNITMGSYQAVDFDGASTGNPSGGASSLLDDDDDLDNNETPVVSLLPSLAFLQGGRQLVAVSQDANGLSESYGPILWRIESPSRVASIFGILDGQWHPIHILDAFYETYGAQKHTPLLLADTPHSHGQQDWPDEWMIEQMYRLHRQQFGSNDFYFPSVQGLLPAPDDAVKVIVGSDRPYELPSPTPIPVTVVQPNGLVLSWEFVNTIILGLGMVFFAIVVVYRRQKQTLRRAQLRVNLAESARRNPPKESQSLPGSSAKGSVRKAIQSDPGETDIVAKPVTAPLVKTSGSTSSEETVHQGVIQQGGIPLIRYARFQSEFSQSRALGKGGFGSVFQCRNNLDGREYAIKKVSIRRKHDDDSSFDHRLQRVLREVKILAMLDHANIVRYYTAWLEVENGVDDETEHADESPSRCYSSSYLTNQTATDWGKSRTNHVRVQNQWSVGSSSESSDIFLPRVPTHRTPVEGEDLGFIFEETEEQDGGGSTPSDAASAAPRQIEPGESKSISKIGRGVFDPSADRNELVAPESALTGNEKELSVRHTLYIQMQLCSFNNLSDFLADPKARKGSLSSGIDVALALRLFLQIARAVQYVHDKGLIHRDLKPNNCFVDEKGCIKVGDFGLSRESNDKDSEAVIETPTVRTRENDDQTAGVGTRLYASPEQSAGSSYDSSTDVYSLGIMLFELCYPMYTGMERNICISRLRDRHQLPLDWDAVVSSFHSLRDLILSMLSQKPEKRPTASDVVDHIQEVLGELTIISLEGEGTSSDDLILLRVEADSEPDTLASTMEQIRQAAHPGSVDILQYGLSQTKDCHTIMEFALRASRGVDAPLLVSSLKGHRRIRSARQVSASR